MTTEFADTVRVLPRGIDWLSPVAEVAVVGCFRVNGATKTKLANDFRWAEVEGFMDCFFNSTEGDFFRSKRVEADRDGVGVADGVGKLNFDSVGQSGSDDIFCDISAHVSCATIYFGGVFSAKGATSMTTRPTIGIDDDFSSGQSAISLRSADHKTACRIHEEFGLPIEHRRGEYAPDQFFCNEFFNLTMRDVGGVLGGDDHGGDPDWF